MREVAMKSKSRKNGESDAKNYIWLVFTFLNPPISPPNYITLYQILKRFVKSYNSFNMEDLGIQLDQKKTLINTLVYYLQNEFSQVNFNTKSALRKEVFKHPKGYVSLDYVLALSEIKDIFADAGVSKISDQKNLIRKLVWENSKTLKCNYNSIRSLKPLVNKVKHKRPIYIPNVPVHCPKYAIQNQLDPKCNLYCTVMKKYGTFFYCLIYCEHPELNLTQERKQRMREKANLELMDYSEFLKARANSFFMKDSLNPNIPNQKDYTKIRVSRMTDQEIDEILQSIEGLQLEKQGKAKYSLISSIQKELYGNPVILSDDLLKKYVTVDPLSFDNTSLFEE